MRSNYKPLGNYISEVNERDTEINVEVLLGVSIQKKFIPSIANIIGTDMSTYKVVRKNQFAYGPVTSRNGDRVSIALLENHKEAIVSQAYTVFEISKPAELLPEYLMMWFRRPEFDRYARFKSQGSAREIFGWEEMSHTELPIPHPDKQREIVTEYNTILHRIDLNNELIKKLEETAQAIYKQWFVNFEFPDENGEPYKFSGGEMVESELGDIPEGWDIVNMGFFVKETVGGDWGESQQKENLSAKVLCIRGTDIPNFKIGKVGEAPTRYIRPDNMKNKTLSAGQIVIELSGGSPTQSTGRTVLILDEHITDSKSPLICSNFCRALSMKDNLYCIYYYSVIDYLYRTDVLFNYENSTIGLKNFDLEGFLREHKIPAPPNSLLKEYNKLYLKTLNKIFHNGRENELLINLRDVLLSKLATLKE